MIFNLYAIKDELSQYSPALMPFEEDAQARRWFRDQVSNNTLMKSNPEDYSIWKVATMETKEGNVTTFNPELIERAKGEKNGN